MPKEKHKKILVEKYITDDLLPQIWNNFQTTGIFDPFSAKMPNTSVQFENIFEDIDEDTEIYRFISFEKFKDLITNKTLTFVSPLLYDEDEKEAECLSEHKLFVFRSLKYLYNTRQLNFENSGIKVTHEIEIDLMNIASRWERIFQYCRRNVFVSCWTLNKPNNTYMWEHYTHNAKDAVAIKTTVKHLKKAISITGHGKHFINKVQYVDWEKQLMNPLNKKYIKTLNALRYSLFFKQTKFKQDNEVRILIDNLTCNATTWCIENTNTILGHKNFDYDQYFSEEARPTKFLKEKILLEDLIDVIFLSPYSTQKDYDQIKNLLFINNCKNFIKKLESI